MTPIKSYKDGDGTSRHHSIWYSGGSDFVDSSLSWFDRGGMYTEGGNASQFYFGRNNGAAARFSSFRIVLTPQ